MYYQLDADVCSHSVLLSQVLTGVSPIYLGCSVEVMRKGDWVPARVVGEGTGQGRCKVLLEDQRSLLEP